MALIAPWCQLTEKLYHEHSDPGGIKRDQEKCGEKCMYMWHGGFNDSEVQNDDLTLTLVMSSC